jgi:putative FmdB family regulatory protein
MPTYEYECTECGAITEVFQSITEPVKRRLKESDAPACDCNVAVKRRIGAGAGIIFKGSGFYQTDYRSESYRKSAKAEKEAIESKGKEGKKDGDKSKKSEDKKPAKKGAAATT